MSALIEVFDKYPLDGSLIEAEAEATYEAMIAASYARLDALQIESDILLAGKELGVMVVEDVQIDANKQGPQTEKNVKGVFNNIQNFLEKIIKFVKEALNNFVEGISNSMASAEEWYKENAKYLDNIPAEVMNSMTLTVIPYWEYTKDYRNLASSGFPMKPDNLNAVLDNLTGKTEISDDQVFPTYFPDLAKLDQDPRRAAFAYYQGPPNGDNVTPVEKSYKGNDCNIPIQKMRAFFDVYKNLINATKNAVTNNEKQMEQVQAKMKNLGVNTEGANFMFGYDLYSEVGECYLTDFIDVVDKYGNPARESILEVTYAMESNTSNPLGGTGAAAPNANTGGNTQNNTNGNNGQTQNTQTNTQQNNTQNNTQQNNANDQKKAQQKANREAKKAERNENKYKETNKVFQMCATVGTARMSALKNIAEHYVNTLQQLVAGIKKYQGIQDEDKENKAYNEKQEKREEMQHKDNLNEIRRNREKVIAAKKGFFTRWASRLFGK